jgi:serine/threonine-protein kinase
VKVVIVPLDARVEVEGKPTLIPAGILEIEGQLGSVHRVRVRKGQLEKTEDVIITDAGPSVPKIELVFGVAAPKPQPSATAPVVPQGVTKDFE